MRSRNTRGFILAQTAGFALVIALLVTGLLALTLHSYTSFTEISRAQMFDAEETKLSNVAKAIVRKNLRDRQPNLFKNLDSITEERYATIDPRFSSSLTPNEPRPGVGAQHLSLPAGPVLGAWRPQFKKPEPAISPLDDFRQILFPIEIPMVMYARRSASESASQLLTKNGSIRMTVREIPVSSFPFLATENVRVDSGITIEGSALHLGKYDLSGGRFAARISPQSETESFSPSGTVFYYRPHIGGSFLADFGEMISVRPDFPKSGKSIVRGQIIQFDGHTLSSDEEIPQAISVQSIDGSKRVLVNISSLPDSNSFINPELGSVPANRISAYHIECTTALAKDRGIVFEGTTDLRSGDYFTTNGAMIFRGSHTGGTLFAASSFGGARFLNSGNAEWNLILGLLNSAPFTSSSSNIVNHPEALPLDLRSSPQSLRSTEIGFDNLILTVEDAAAIGIGLGSPERNAIHFERSGPLADFFIRMEALAEPVLAQYPFRGPVKIGLSRTQRQLRVEGESIAYIDIPTPRLETTHLRIDPTNTGNISILTNGFGSTIGAQIGEVRIVGGIFCSGVLSRFGVGTFRVVPNPQVSSVIEQAAPRFIVVD